LMALFPLYYQGHAQRDNNLSYREWFYYLFFNKVLQ
jgi:hypothetical protein